MKFKLKALAVCMMASGMLMAAGGAHAGTTLINAAGTVALGVNDNGSLNTSSGSVAVNSSRTGVSYKFSDGSFYDATSPGCYCEGWGVSVNNTVSGYANVAIGGGGLSYGALTGVTASTATSTTTLTSLPGITVTQTYQSATNAPGALFRNHVTITNTTGAAVTDVKYVRVMDWDVPHTEFNEFVTIQGTGSTSFLEESGNNGFNTANPLAGYSNGGSGTGGYCHNMDCTAIGPLDHGAYFRFNFGSLADGASREFDIFYGAAANEAGAFSAIAAEGIELFSLGYSNTAGKYAYSGAPATGSPTFVFGFKGVGGSVITDFTGGDGSVTTISPVPEPETYGMLLAGLGLLGFTARRRKDREQA